MSFLLYDLSFLILSTLAVVIFLYVKRKNLKRDGPMYLYRTSIGLEVIDYIGKKYKKTLNFLSYIVVSVGYLLMIAAFYLLFQLVYIFTKPELVKAIKVPPLMPLIPYLPELFKIDYLPPFYFTYWIIAIALVAICHEGFHGIFARFYNVKIKSTGFGFLGPFLAFFVEQDDKQLRKTKPFSQMVVLAAGVFANVLLAILFFFLMVSFFNCNYTASGAMFNDYTYSIVPLSIFANATITNENIAVDGIDLTKIYLDNKSYFAPEAFKEANASEDTWIKIYQNQPAIRSSLRGAIISINGKPIKITEDIRPELDLHNPGEKITLQTKVENSSILNYELILGADYENETRAVLGIATLQASSAGFRGFLYRLINSFKDPNAYYEPNSEFAVFIYNLLWWIFLINFSVAVANMIPLSIFDGGRFFYLAILLATKKEKIAEKAFKWVAKLLLWTLVLLMVLWVWGIF